eukprot:365554-Chlamydomonas_euryale.AAC.23
MDESRAPCTGHPKTRHRLGATAVTIASLPPPPPFHASAATGEQQNPEALSAAGRCEGFQGCLEWHKQVARGAPKFPFAAFTCWAAGLVAVQ